MCELSSFAKHDIDVVKPVYLSPGSINICNRQSYVIVVVYAVRHRM